MKKVLVLTIIILVLLVGCRSKQPAAESAIGDTQAMSTIPTPVPTEEPAPKIDEIVRLAVGGWDQPGVGIEQVDTALKYFTEEAVFKMVGFPPEVPADFSGKQAIRAAFESWLPLHPRLKVEIQKVEGDTVTAMTSYWSDPMNALGVTPLVGTDVYVIKDGLIVSEIWTLTDESQAKLLKAMAAAQMTPEPDPYITKIAGTYTTTFTKEDYTKSGMDLVGEWKFIFKEDGLVEVYWGNDLETRGHYSIDQEKITFQARQGYPEGSYNWSLEGDTLVLTLIKDSYKERKYLTTMYPLTKQ